MPKYFHCWKDAYLICEEYINNMHVDISSVGTRHFIYGQQAGVSQTMYDFIEIILKSYNESKK